MWMGDYTQPHELFGAQRVLDTIANKNLKKKNCNLSYFNPQTVYHQYKTGEMSDVIGITNFNKDNNIESQTS